MDLNLFEIRYEDLVQAQEATVRQALGFVGVAFEPGCLSFTENRRYARTASYAQVSEPLYDRSIGRYRNYLPFLGPAIAQLQEVIARMGYTV
jgi:hypothetical protein